MKNNLTLILCLLWSFTALSQAIDTTQQVVKGRKNSISQQKKPYVIMISVDGMRYDLARKYEAKNLLALGRSGVMATSMIPSYPSVTFPNHYTLVTGLYPSHHGMVGNRYYDRKFKEIYTTRGKPVLEGKWYGGVPLWVLAEQQKMLTASFYWVGSEAPIKGLFPTYYYKYNEKISISNRIKAVVNWLKLPAATRPHFITFYFPEVDHAGHKFGPDAPETRDAVLFIDSAVNQLNKAVKATGLKVNFILVSDHGMTNIDGAHTLAVPTLIDTAKFKVLNEGELVQIYAKDTAATLATYQALKKQASGYNVYLRGKTPLRWHYNTANDRYNRIADILLIPQHPKIFTSGSRKPNPGAHGYDPALVKDMHATFLSWGPAFKSKLTVPAFENVEVYPVVTQLLGLKITEPVDGTKRLSNKILKK
jgi:predicted AlkP superfamily pyrophosphatase or phosphodiesterase